MAVQVQRGRFTLADYEQMITFGILREDDRVELVRGEIVKMSPIGPLHADVVDALNDLLVFAVGRLARVRPENPIRLEPASEPQPDFSIVRRRRYRSALPGPADILLVIEVADSSVAYDRAVKLPLYAAAGIPEAWLVDLAAERIERHIDPVATGYRQILLAGRGDAITSLALPELSLAVDDVLG